MSAFDTLISESDNPTTLEVVINTDPWSSAAISRLMSMHLEVRQTQHDSIAREDVLRRLADVLGTWSPYLRARELSAEHSLAVVTLLQDVSCLVRRDMKVLTADSGSTSLPTPTHSGTLQSASSPNWRRIVDRCRQRCSSRGSTSMIGDIRALLAAFAIFSAGRIRDKRLPSNGLEWSTAYPIQAR
jgi:hypothetical protein